MHAISSYHGNRPTNTDRDDYNALRRSFASAQCNYIISNKSTRKSAYLRNGSWSQKFLTNRHKKTAYPRNFLQLPISHSGKDSVLKFPGYLTPQIIHKNLSTTSVDIGFVRTIVTILKWQNSFKNSWIHTVIWITMKGIKSFVATHISHPSKKFQ